MSLTYNEFESLVVTGPTRKVLQAYQDLRDDYLEMCYRFETANRELTLRLKNPRKVMKVHNRGGQRRRVEPPHAG